MTIGNEHYIIKKNQLVLIPENVCHIYKYTSSPYVVLYCMNFRITSDGMDLFTKLNLADSHHVVTLDDPSEFTGLIENALYSHGYTDEYATRVNLCVSAMKIAALYVAEREKETPSDVPAALLKTIEYMQQNTDKNISIAELATLCELHPSYYIAKFKTVFGKSPKKYFDVLRAERAAKLLLETAFSPAEIGGFIGIHQPKYFAQFFEAHIGVSPEEYLSIFKNADQEPAVSNESYW